MAPNIPDRYLWLGLGTPFPEPHPDYKLTTPGVFTFFAVQHVAHGLRVVRTLTETHHPPPQIPGTPSSSESAIKTSSLLALASSHNVEISASATKLLCERFYASASARRFLLRDQGSPKAAVQRKAQLAFRLLRDHGVFREYGLSYGYAGIEPRVGWEDVEILPAVPRGLREPLQEDGEEERDVRRRRREAVVIHDGEGRVGEGDVWMRDREGVMSLDMEVGELVIDGVVH